MAHGLRTVLVTGGGGAGRTTTAAVTAVAASRSGLRTLLLGTGGSDLLGADPDRAAGGPGALTDDRPKTAALPWSSPAETAPGLWTARLDAGAAFRDHALALQRSCGPALDLLGSTPLARDELTELPGAEALAVLRVLRLLHGGAAHPANDHTGPATRPPWDLVVVDMPPAEQTVALLALPEQLRRYLRRLLPAERQAARALRPLLAQIAGVAMPANALYEGADRAERELAAAQAAVESPATTVRLVVEPGPRADAALRAARAGLALHGHRVDALVANRVLPTGSPDPWLAALADQQQTSLARHRRTAEDEGVPLYELPHLGRDPHGLDDLAALASRAGVTAPGGTPGDGRETSAAQERVEDRRAHDGVLVWHLPLPGADRDSTGLVRHGDELVVTTGPFRRVLPLPSALRRCTVSGAGLRDGVLAVRFTPDAALWPSAPGDESRIG